MLIFGEVNILSEAFSSFLAIVEVTAPYSIAWALGIKAYKFVVGAMTGKDVSI